MSERVAGSTGSEQADDQATPALTGRAILGATIGNMLEFYDFITYSFFAIQIGHTFFPSQNPYNSPMLSLATFGAGFVTRPIGALVIGAYSDRVGRRHRQRAGAGVVHAGRRSRRPRRDGDDAGDRAGELKFMSINFIDKVRSCS